MKSIILLKMLITVPLLAMHVSSTSPTLTGRDIMQKVVDRPDGENRKARLSMELINKRGSKRIRSLISYSMDVGKDTKNLMFFLAPADVKGTAFLTWEYDNPDKEDDRWLYLPAMSKTRRISGTSAKNDYFMGTDFTYEDMGKRNIDESTYKLLKEDQIDNRSLWVVESKPKDPRDLYSKLISYIDKEQLIAHKVEFYDRSGNLLKTLNVSEIKKVDGIWTIHSMHMVNHLQQHETILTISDVAYNVSIDENLFTVSTMERGIIE